MPWGESLYHCFGDECLGIAIIPSLAEWLLVVFVIVSFALLVYAVPWLLSRNSRKDEEQTEQVEGGKHG